MSEFERSRRFREITSRVSPDDLNWVWMAIFFNREPGVEYLNVVARDLVALRDDMKIANIESALRETRSNENG